MTIVDMGAATPILSSSYDEDSKRFMSRDDPSKFHLGELETEVMTHVWQLGRACSVAELHQRLDKKLAYTTVMTVMSNLHKKGLLLRQKEGKAYLYSPKRSRAEVQASSLQKLIRGLFGNDEPAFLACFLGMSSKLANKDIQALKQELERLERDHA